MGSDKIFSIIHSDQQEYDTLYNQLISTTYQAAAIPEQWPELLICLSRLVEHIGTSSTNNQNYFQNNPADLKAFHLHLEKAVQVGDKTEQLAALRDQSQQLLDRLPLAIFFVDRNCKLRMCNSIGNKILETCQYLRLDNCYLTTYSGTKTKQLHRMVDMLLFPKHDTDAPSSDSIRLINPKSGVGISLLVTVERSLVGVPGLAAILVAHAGTVFEPSIKSLKNLYSLTETESRLTASLVLGKTIQEYAKSAGVSPHTARNQLKSVFQKTGTGRQATLVQMVITGPAMLSQSGISYPLTVEPQTFIGKKFCREEEIRLADGRRLAYAEYGDMKAEPVLVMHGIDGCRLQMPIIPQRIQKAGVRLIVPDRPGFGRSDPQSGRSMLGWASDIKELVKAIDLHDVSVVGVNAGGPYALVLGHMLKRWVRKVVIVNSAGPPETLRFYSSCTPFWKMVLRVARYTPSVFSALVQILLRGVLRNPEAYFDNSSGLGSKNEKMVFSSKNKHMRDFYLKVLYEASRQGVSHIAYDANLIIRPWGFNLEDIDLPVHLWHGIENTIIPIQVAEYLASQLSDVRKYFIDGEGNYLYLSHFEEILKC